MIFSIAILPLMLKEKLTKHSIILSRRFRQPSEINKMRSYNNQTLNKVLDAFIKTVSGDFSDEEKLIFSRCEQYRRVLLEDEGIIPCDIFKADTHKTVSESAKASSTIKWCQLLFNLTKHSGAKNVLEIGTNLGVSGGYILEALKPVDRSFFVSMEGLPRSCEIASDQFNTITNGEHFKVVQGLYDKTFPEIMATDTIFDLIFIDGNHQKEPTLYYFKELKTKSNRPVIFIFDDINWSKGMKETWSIIKQDKDVSYTIDLWRWGIVIIDDGTKHRNLSSALHLTF